MQNRFLNVQPCCSDCDVVVRKQSNRADERTTTNFFELPQTQNNLHETGEESNATETEPRAHATNEEEVSIYLHFDNNRQLKPIWNHIANLLKLYG